MKTVTVEIDENGKMSFDFGGFEGKACETEDAAIRALLGKVGVSVVEEFKREEATKNGGKQFVHSRQTQ